MILCHQGWPVSVGQHPWCQPHLWFPTMTCRSIPVMAVESVLRYCRVSWEWGLPQQGTTALPQDLFQSLPWLLTPSTLGKRRLVGFSTQTIGWSLEGLEPLLGGKQEVHVSQVDPDTITGRHFQWGHVGWLDPMTRLIRIRRQHPERLWAPLH